MAAVVFRVMVSLYPFKRLVSGGLRTTLLPIVASGCWVLVVGVLGSVMPLLAQERTTASLVGSETSGNRDATESAPTTIVVGAESHNFPYSFLDEKGQLSGFAVELLDAVAAKMDLRIKRVVLPNNDVKQQFREGNFHMLQLLTEAGGREAWADFSVPVLYAQIATFVPRKFRHVRSVSDLPGHRFALAGSLSDLEQYREEALDGPVFTDNAEQALRLVNEEKVDGTMLARTTAIAIMRKNNFRNIVEIPEAAQRPIRRAFVVHPGDRALLAKLNEGLALLQRSGEYDRLYRKWVLRYDPIQLSREKVYACLALGLTIALALAIWIAFRQRRLRQRLLRKSADLLEQTEFLAAIYENMPVSLLCFDLEPAGPRLTTLNRRASEKLGIATAMANGRRLEELTLVPDWSTLLQKLVSAPLDAGAPAVTEYRLNALRRQLLVTRIPLSARADKRVHRLCLLIDDVTDRRRLDEEIAQGRRLRAVGELVGGIAHEFNNLMTPVLLKVGDLRDQRRSDAPLQADLAVVEAAISRAADLTARLLTLGRKADGTQVVSGTQVASVVTEVAEAVRGKLDSRIAFETAVPGGLPPLGLGKRDLGHILGSLLSNANDTLIEKLAASRDKAWRPRIRLEATELPADAAPAPTSAATAARKLNGWLRLAVADNGQGMTSEVCERVFEPFFTTKKTVGKGTGLGLPTVWHLVTTAGGRVDLESTPDEGSTFSVLLPIWAMATSSVPERTPAARRPGDAATILVAEDDRNVADAMTAVLRRAGHRVRNFEDGMQAAEHICAHPSDYALMIVDINMPGLDGLELTRRARAAGYVAGVLVVSGRIGMMDPGALDSAGVDHALAKPFSGDEMMAIVEACLTKRAGSTKLS